MSEVSLLNVFWTLVVQYVAPLLVGGIAVAPVVEILKKVFGFQDKFLSIGELRIQTSKVVAFIVAIVESVIYHAAVFDEPINDASIVALVVASTTSAAAWYKIAYSPLHRIAGTEKPSM